MTRLAEPPLIYNLFPRHFVSIDLWHGQARHAARMGFNWIFVNPFHYPGFSGSLYAVKDFYLLNPLFLKPGQKPSDLSVLRNFIAYCSSMGMGFMMDLVINHTAIDSVLVEEHPAWFKRDRKGKLASPYAVDPDDPSRITVWGDLAEIDNTRSSEKNALWEYWDALIAFYQDMGVAGFRCDAAYKVPAALWKTLIRGAKERNGRTLFAAETLGCTPHQTLALKGTGFDYLFNSSKYWNFDRAWCIEQHEQYQAVAPSISFPESHDTPRLAAEAPGTLSMQKNRYVLAASFSQGLLMPMGYELGAVTAMDVVKGTPADVDPPRWNLTEWVSKINRFKLRSPLMRGEGHWKAVNTYDSDILFLEKRPSKGKDRMVLLVNKDWHNSRTVTKSEFPAGCREFPAVMRPFDDESTQPSRAGMELRPAEIVLLLRD